MNARVLALSTCFAAALGAGAAHATTILLNGAITSAGTGPNGLWGQRYQGEYTLSLTYVVNATQTFDKKGKLVKTTFDPAGSYVVITDVTDTSGPFDTLDIPITSASFYVHTGTLETFSFGAKDWYKGLPASLTQDGISGSIDPDGVSFFSARYEHLGAGPYGKTSTLRYIFDTARYMAPPHNAPFIPFPGMAGVPEPGAWWLTIVGFGLAGAGLRRRRDPKAAAG
ncbi:MAG TPA: PEP-CTERM sorting domain-containing protein [Caulobacteraceae bacterium]|nr:PEP-CTERM sorting domain-containing protein [Caulobacteraceae bacterium]